MNNPVCSNCSKEFQPELELKPGDMDTKALKEWLQKTVGLCLECSKLKMGYRACFNEKCQYYSYSIDFKGQPLFSPENKKTIRFDKVKPTDPTIKRYLTEKDTYCCEVCHKK